MSRDFPGTGGNYLEASASGAANISGPEITVACWYRADVMNSVHRGLVNKSAGVASDSQYALRIRSTNTLTCHISDGGYSILTASTPLTAGVWQHGCMRLGAGILDLFLNGINDATVATARSIRSGTYPLTIGMSGVGGEMMDGRIAEVGIWDAALTDAEILSLARGFSPALVRPQSLRVYLPLDGNSSPEPDLRNGNNAAVVGAVAKAEHSHVILPRSAIYVP